MPLQWAIMQNNYGNVLQLLGTRTSDPALSARFHAAAIAAYQQALMEWTPERAAAHWSIAQNNMANADQSLAYRDLPNAVTHLSAAEAAQTLALSHADRAETPLNWAAFTFNRGRTSSMLGDFAATPAEAITLYGRAVEDFRAALEEMTFERVPLQWAGAQTSLANVLQAMAGRETDAEAAVKALEASEAAGRASIQVYQGDRFARERAAALHTQGTTLIMLGERGGGVERFREAEAAYREALSLRPRETMPYDWAFSAAGTGNALLNIGIATNSRKVLAEARALTQGAWDAIKPFDRQYDGVLTQRLAQIDAALAKGN